LVTALMWLLKVRSESINTPRLPTWSVIVRARVSRYLPTLTLFSLLPNRMISQESCGGEASGKGVGPGSTRRLKHPTGEKGERYERLLTGAPERLGQLALCWI